MARRNGELELIDISQLSRTRAAAPSVRQRKKNRSGAGLLITGAVLCLILVCVAVLTLSTQERQIGKWLWQNMAGEKGEAQTFLNSPQVKEQYPTELLELAERNEEALDFVRDYINREDWQEQPVDLTGDYTQGKVPLLMQWDKRWGYNRYGDNIIGLAGCGPVCLNMAYLYFTGDTSMNPRTMAEFTYENGYYTSAGTSWNLWTEGVAKLGMSGETLSLDENAMKSTLDNGGLIVCSMAPGDFTTTGHFILLTGYNEKGFFVNDPNRHSTSNKQWDFETLQYQIKNLWGIYP